MLLKEQLKKVSKAVAAALLFSFVLTHTFAAQTIVGSRLNRQSGLAATYPSLAKYTTDLTSLAKAGRLSLNTNFDGDADVLAKSLADNDPRQIVILDQTGDNQEAIVSLLAARIANGTASSALSGKRVLKLELSRVFEDVNDKSAAAAALLG